MFKCLIYFYLFMKNVPHRWIMVCNISQLGHCGILSVHYYICINLQTMNVNAIY